MFAEVRTVVSKPLDISEYKAAGPPFWKQEDIQNIGPHYHHLYITVL
jgi:hypothetical protein